MLGPALALVGTITFAHSIGEGPVLTENLSALSIHLAALGVLRFPDLFIRLHANSKQATLGMGCLMVAVVAVLLFLTALVGAHCSDGRPTSPGFRCEKGRRATCRATTTTLPRTRWQHLKHRWRRSWVKKTRAEGHPA